MPWRLLVLIIILGILLGFIGFNLNNTCDLSLGFKVFKGVPIYLTVFASFMLGMVSSLPFIIFGSLRKKMKKEKKHKSLKSEDDRLSKEKTDDKIDNSGSYGID